MSARRIPANIILAVRELTRPYVSDLDEEAILQRLSAPVEANPRPAPKEALLTVPEAAAFLGACRATVYNLLRDGQLPRVKIRNMTRIRQSDLEALAAGSKGEE